MAEDYRLSWPLRQEWPAETLALSIPPAEQWCDPVATFDCHSEGACRDCGNDLDTLCPLLALPGVLAVVRATSDKGSSAARGSGT